MRNVRSKPSNVISVDGFDIYFNKLCLTFKLIFLTKGIFLNKSLSKLPTLVFLNVKNSSADVIPYKHKTDELKKVIIFQLFLRQISIYINMKIIF